MKKSKKISKSVWKDLGVNFVMQGKEFFVSFNPDTGNGRAETALVKKDKYFILDGDFRKEYEKLVPKGYSVCLKFFNSKKHFKSFWSN